MNRFIEGVNIPRSILVLDNSSTHWNLELQKLLAEAGVKVIFLPPYSPMFNPIEEAFSKVKHFLRRNHKTIIDWNFEDSVAIFAAFSSITRLDCEGWVRNAGYD